MSQRSTKKISVALITKNEDRNIRTTIESCAPFDEIVVVDAGSEDNTVEIASSLGARCITSSWRGFGPQKQFAVESCFNHWVLSLDADEKISDTLGQEIRAL